MYKTITTIILTGLAVLFGMQNFNHVPISIFWGKAINIRLIFVIAIAGVAGYLIRHFIGISREDAMRRRFQSMRMNSMNNSQRKMKLDDFEEDEEF